jgi:hypothetical protein
VLQHRRNEEAVVRNRNRHAFYTEPDVAATRAQVRFLVMGNVFPTEVRLHRKYDLKGSTHGRTAGPDALTAPNTILKVRGGYMKGFPPGFLGFLG